jgi:tRNA A-37 threonylcarbamoyl transferase component Bud32
VVTAPDIPGHRVSGVLGAGGFATVYRCWQLAVGREVAVKLDNRVLFTERDRRRFIREVTAAGRLSGHPHVIDVYDAGTLGDGRPFLVMELCPAGSLNDALRRNGPMPVAQVRDIGIRLADALAAAHASGVLHRDIKPANILVNRFGMVGLADFGLASIVSAHGDQTASREALTPAFSSPETFRGEEPTVLADVYSLAATLYTLLSGRPPRFPADGGLPSFATIMMLHDKPVEDVPGTPPELMALLRAALSPDPAARPQSAAVLRDALADPRGYVPAAASGYVHAAPPGYDGRVGPPGHPGPVREVSTPTWDSRVSAPTWDHQGSVPARDRQAESTGTARRVSARHVGMAAGLIVIVVAILVTGARFFPHGAGAGGGSNGTSSGAGMSGASSGARPGGAMSAASVFGIATKSAGCPAAALRVATARCPATPECFNGLTVISGAASAEQLPCDGPHVWETFAIAILPAEVHTFDQPMVAADPTVQRVCSEAVMLASRQGPARRRPAQDWDIQVLPPSEAGYDSGSRVYRCLANEIGHEPRTSQFRR